MIKDELAEKLAAADAQTDILMEDLDFLEELLPFNLEFLAERHFDYDLVPDPPLDYEFHPLVFQKPKIKKKPKPVKPDIIFVER